jgi:hypothetical protein
MNIKHFVRFDFYSPGDGSDETDGILAFWLQTVQLEAPGNGMMRSGSNNSTPIAHNRDSPWMMLV